MDGGEQNLGMKQDPPMPCHASVAATNSAHVLRLPPMDFEEKGGMLPTLTTSDAWNTKLGMEALNVLT